jgi:3-phosphoshikimate 1-carboxyvinyltransferase
MYVLAALARGESVLRSPLHSDDTNGLLDALEHLGSIVRIENNVTRIDGSNGQFPKGGSVNLGAGGTPCRFMIAAAALARLPVEVDGNERMRERPIAEGVNLLRMVGGNVDYAQEDGRLPVVVRPSSPLAGGTIEVGRTASSQFISALMLLAPWMQNGLRVVFDEPPTSETYLELTVRALQWVSADLSVAREGGSIKTISIKPSLIKGFDHQIEADASTAVYPAALAALLPDARIEILGLAAGSAQPDLGAIKAMRTLGANVELLDDRIVVSSATRLTGFDLDCSAFPDAALMLAIMASRCEGRSTLRGLRTLRVKETDRIAALATELRQFGCEVEEGPDSLTIEPGIDSGASVHVETYLDHRMAMAFAILGAVRGNVVIENPDCAAKSHPGFWAELDGFAGGSKTGDTS